MRKVAMAVFALSVLFGGCASVPMTSIEDDAAAKRFAVEQARSSIYVFRNETFGGAAYLPVALDGKIVGRTSGQTYFLLDVAPGSHEISTLAENVAKITLEAKPGKAHYVWQEVKMGMWAPRAQLAEVDEAIGRAGVLECKRALAEY